MCAPHYLGRPAHRGSYRQNGLLFCSFLLLPYSFRIDHLYSEYIYKVSIADGARRTQGRKTKRWALFSKRGDTNESWKSGISVRESWARFLSTWAVACCGLQASVQWPCGEYGSDSCWLNWRNWYDCHAVPPPMGLPTMASNPRPRWLTSRRIRPFQLFGETTTTTSTHAGFGHNQVAIRLSSHKLFTFYFSRLRLNGVEIDRCVCMTRASYKVLSRVLHLEPFTRQQKTCLPILNKRPADTIMIHRKRPSLRVPSTPTFKMPIWWPKFARKAIDNKTSDAAFVAEELKRDSMLSGKPSWPAYWETLPSVALSLSSNCTTFSSSDNNVPVSLRVPPTLPDLWAEELIASPTDNSFRPLPARSSSEYVFTSNPHAIESSGRFCEVEEILQMRTIRGHGLHTRRVKQYLVQWAPTLLSVTELRYAQKTWKIVKSSQDVHAEKGEGLDQKIMVEWALLWIASFDLGPRISASDIASHLLIK